MLHFEKAFKAVIDEVNQRDPAADARIAWGGKGPDEIADLLKYSSNGTPAASALLECHGKHFEITCLHNPLVEIPEFLLWRELKPAWLIAGNHVDVMGEVIKANFMGRPLFRPLDQGWGIFALAAALPLCALNRDSLLASIEIVDAAHMLATAKARGVI